VVTKLNTGFTTLTQYIIPRFANGTTHPAGHLRGYGAASGINGNLYGPSDGSNPQEIVVTEDYTATNMDHWTNGSLATPAVLQAEVRDLMIAGKDDSGNGYGEGGVVDDVPGVNNPVTSYKNRETGLYIQSSGPLVDNVRFFHIAGTCCVIKGPAGLGNLIEPYQPFDREKAKVRDVWCLRAYSGVEVAQVDTVIGNIVCRALRDWGVKISSASTQIDGPIHLFGVSSAPALVAGAIPSPAAWLPTNADRCWGGPWYVETSDIGIKIESNASALGPMFSKNCVFGNFQVFGKYNTIRDYEIIPVTSDTWVATGTAQGGSASTIQLAAATAFANDGINGLRAVITSGTGAGQSRTITDYVGSTDTATISPNWVTSPSSNSVYVIRQAPCIDVANHENSIINGRMGPGGAIPDGVVAVRITAGTRQTIRDLILFGTANSSAPLISVEGSGFVVLNDSIIVAKCFDAGTFLELYPTMARGTAQGSTSTTIQLAATENFPDNWLNGAKIFITGGPGNGQERSITDYVGVSDTVTVSAAWATNPTSSSTYEVKVSRIGTGNYIWLTTDGTVTTSVNLPPDWNDNTNEIWVDGVRQSDE
jgi:hypothetical protein